MTRVLIVIMLLVLCFLWFIFIAINIKLHPYRQTIRTTWGSGTGRGRQWAGQSLQHHVALVFVFATDNYTPHDVDVISKESMLYGDVIAGKLVDSYHNLTLKILFGMQWAVTACPGIKFVVKVDQDTFLNLHLLLRMLDSLMTAGRSPFALGYHHLQLKPRAMRHSRWKISEKVYPPYHFPRYFYGHSYVTSADLLPAILHTARRLPYFPLEDAFFTGVLPLLLNFNRIHSQRFAVSLRTVRACDMLSERFVSITGISVQTQRRVWDILTSGGCDRHEVIKRNSFRDADRL